MRLPITLLLVGIAVAAMAATGCEQGQTPRAIPLGMWVWRDTDFSTVTARRDLVAFCRAHGIVHLDVHTRLVETGAGFAPREGEALGQLVEEAARRGITVSSLRGAPRMFMAETRDQTLRELHALVSLDDSLRAVGPGLLGVKYDVEPYATPEWRGGGEARLQVIDEYLVTMKQIRQVLDARESDLTLAADVPFWWDKDEYVVPFGGQRQTFVSHVQGLTDYIAVMSYRRSAAKVLWCVEKEMASAVSLGRQVCPSLETGQLSKDQHISFFGTPTEAMWTCVDSLRAQLETNPAVRLIMLHHYGSVRDYLESGDGSGGDG